MIGQRGALLQRCEWDGDEPIGQLQAQALVEREEQQSVPHATVSFSGAEALRVLPDRVIPSSKMIDLVARWTPGPKPPNGHSPQALVGWIQNITYKNEQADYYDDGGRYVETSFREYIGDLIDSDDPKSAWYDPPRPYAELVSPQLASLHGSANRSRSGPIGAAMVDKPQDTYARTSPRGGRLGRFGAVTEFCAYLVIMEPHGHRGTVLEHVAWKYEYAYSSPREPVAGEEGLYETDYCDTHVVRQGEGIGDRHPNLEVSGPHGNAFFNDHFPATWEVMPAGNDAQRFPSLI